MLKIQYSTSNKFGLSDPDWGRLASESYLFQGKLEYVVKASVYWIVIVYIVSISLAKVAYVILDVEAWSD